MSFCSLYEIEVKCYSLGKSGFSKNIFEYCIMFCLMTIKVKNGTDDQCGKKATKSQCGERQDVSKAECGDRINETQKSKYFKNINKYNGDQ